MERFGGSSRGFSRRAFVRGALVSGVTVLVAACSSATPPSPTQASSTTSTTSSAGAAPTTAAKAGAAPASQAPTTSGGSKTLSYWGFSLNPDSIKYLKSTVNADFQKKYPDFTVEPQFVPYAGYRDKEAVAVAGGTLPDIYEEGTQVAGQMATNGGAIVVDDYIKSWSDKDDIFPAAWQTSFYAGHHWGVPFYSQPSATMYWKSAYQSAGLDPTKAPTDEQEYLDNAKKLQQVDKGATVRLGGWAPGDGQGMFQGFEVGVQRRGGKIANDDYSQPLFNSPEGLDSLQYLVDLWQAVYPNGVARLPSQSPIPYFAEKKIAENLRGYSTDANDVVKYNVQAWDDLAIAKPVTSKGGTRPVSIEWRNMQFVAPTTKFRDQSMEWVHAFVSTKNNGEFCRIMGYAPIRKSALDLDWVKQSKFMQTYLTIASPYGYDVINPPGYFELRKKSADQFEAAATGKQTVKDALQKVYDIWAEGLKNAPKVKIL